MSYPRDLDEMSEDELRLEIIRRREARLAGQCDYCARPLDAEPACRFPGRHGRVRSPAPVRHEEDGLTRLVLWLSEHPLEHAEVARRLRMPLRKCEGHDGPCENEVLWLTPAMTAYSWDGQGEDPNRPRFLCPTCSDSYRSDWQEKWDEYNAEILAGLSTGR